MPEGSSGGDLIMNHYITQTTRGLEDSSLGIPKMLAERIRQMAYKLEDL